MLAHAFLTILAILMNDAEPHHDGARLIPTTLGEARRLFTALTTTASRTVEQILAWSRWRRRHQHHAQRSHHQRREGSITAATDPIDGGSTREGHQELPAVPRCRVKNRTELSISKDGT